MVSILGISAFYHDSAAALVVDGEIIAAVQEERFTRKKHDSNYPHNSINFVLEYGKLKLEEIDYVVFYEKPFLKFERLIETYVANAPRGFGQFVKSVPIWIKYKLFQKKILINNLKKIDSKFDEKKLLFSEHHLSHAASAFYPSPFKEAIVLTADGVGEWATTTVAIGKGKDLEIKKELHFPHSLGLLYSAFTYYTGFKVNSGEYKMMGLAPYGEPKYLSLIKKNLIDIKEDGTFWLNQKYFDYSTGFEMTNKNFEKLFKRNRRDPKKEKLDQFYMDIAASIQNVIEEIMLKLIKSLKNEYEIDNLCLAGGVALNCVANGKIVEKKIFKNIWIQPAAGDAGGALGAALAIWYIKLKKNRIINSNDDMKGSYLGPEYSQEIIEEKLKKIGAIYEIMDEKSLVEFTADELTKGNAIGWFQGRMEFGPRSLGNRSILADPRNLTMQKNLNLKVKFRESFRPFAPSVLENKYSEWFNLDEKSPYMLLVAKVSEQRLKNKGESEEKLFGIDKLNIVRSSIPAVTHVDYTARIQTVNEKLNNLYYNLIKEFENKTSCPILINTSFNVRGEPIVNTPEDAFNCFMGNKLDFLIIGKCVLNKKKQNLNLIKDYKEQFELD
ncbi:MAG: carbamoyltransferase [Candidatus Pelagibacter sp.]